MTRFPDAATANAWSAIGWNDFAATFNEILQSQRCVPMRLSRWFRQVEEHLVYPSRNMFYLAGVEDCLLLCKVRSTPIAPCQHYIESKMVDLPCTTPCDFCGEPMDSALLCDGGLLSNFCCSEQCLKNKLNSTVQGDIVLFEMFSMKPHRRDAPIPEDDEQLIEHFESIPSCKRISMVDAAQYKKELMKQRGGKVAMVQ